MPIKKRLRQYLEDIAVFKIDTNENSIIFNIKDFPEILTAGKNSFKILGNSLLKKNSEVLIEILDANGNPIYFEVNDFIDRLKQRIISIFIYPDTPIGKAKITILGTLDSDSIPENWKNKPNVKWVKIIDVDSLQQNNSEIIFNEFPEITISEQFKAAKTSIYSPQLIISASKLDFENSTIKYYNYIDSSWAKNYGVYKNLFSETFSSVAKNKQSVQQNFNLNENRETKFNAISNTNIISDNEYYISNKSGPTIVLQTQVSGSGFSSKMIGGEFIVSSPVNSKPACQFVNSYKSIISDVLNKTTLRLESPFFISSSTSQQTNTFFITEFGPNDDYVINYTNTAEYSSSQAYTTFATIKFNNFSPISGNVYRIKTFVKSKASSSDYEQIGNTIINSSNFLIDTQSADFNLSIGNFTSQQIIDSYWEVSSISTGSGTLSFDETYLSNSIKIERSFDDENIILKVNPILNQEYFENNEYQIKFNCFGIKNYLEAKIKVYMSGSAFYDSDENNLGYLIGTILFNEKKQTFQDLTFLFTAQKTSTATPVFLIEAGSWFISNVRISAQSYPGFTPNHFLLNVPINSLWDNNILDFKFEFFDYTERISNQIIYVENFSFSKGSPFYIQGDYNLLTGSQYIGNELNKGILLSGNQGSSFSSINYRGFTSASEGKGPAGFLIWSGSVLSTESDSYSGIGSEFIANSESYFRFRTNPSEIDVRTNKFFFGSNDQYISGSGGLVEISSSNFYLDNQGYLTATAATLKRYVFTDYIANNVLTINNSNVDNYLITYSHPTLSKNFNYLDLSGESKESAMFVRFEISSSYPISHIVAPTISGYLDNSVGGNIVLEFANTAAGNGVHFYDLRKDVGDQNIEFLNANNLSGSNSIHNLSGSFSYLGFKLNHTASDGSTIFSGSLSAKENARYLFSKGNTGWSLVGTSNFDRTGISLLEINTPYLTGVRRNDFIRPNELHCSNATGSYSRKFDEIFNLPCLDISLTSIDGIPQYSSVYGTILLPDFIKANAFKFILYCRLMPDSPGLFVPGTYILSSSLSPICTSQPLTDDELMSNIQPKTQYVLPTQIDSAKTDLITGEEMINWFATVTESKYLISGQIIGFKFDVLSMRLSSSALSGKVRIYGVRIISDISTNVGGFDTSDVDNSKKEKTMPPL